MIPEGIIISGIVVVSGLFIVIPFIIYVKKGRIDIDKFPDDLMDSILNNFEFER